MRTCLEDGELYAAKFHDRRQRRVAAPDAGGSTGMGSKAEICIHTRQAASCSRRDDDGSPGMGGGKPAQGGSLLRAHEQQEPRQEAK